MLLFSPRPLFLVAGLALLLALPLDATAQDRCTAYRHSGMSGATYTTTLPDVPDTWSSVANWRPGSNRRLGNQLKSTSVYKEASSFQIWATESDVTLYLYEGDNFNGRMLRHECEKGHRCWISNAGWFNDRLGSFKCQREIIAENDLQKLIETPIPLDALVGSIRDKFGEQLSSNGDVGSYDLKNTQVNATQRNYMRRQHFSNPEYWGKYRDLIRIYQRMSIRPEWWPSEYTSRVWLYYSPYLNGDNTLDFSWAGWRVWVEGGVFTDKILDGLSGAVSGSLTSTETEMRQTIKDRIYEEGRTIGDIVWEDVQKVGLANTCETFNDRSGHSQPAQPYCWAYGSTSRMFPPTIILYHKDNV